MTNYGLYDGYDSYNEVSESSDDGEGMEPEVVQESPVYTPPVGQKTEYRFMNGKDGMGKARNVVQLNYCVATMPLI